MYFVFSDVSGDVFWNDFGKFMFCLMLDEYILYWLF